MNPSHEIDEKLTSVLSQNSDLKIEIGRLKANLAEVQNSSALLEKKYNALKNLIKRKDELAARLEKLSGVGQYVPEIIHKLKNPLMGISGYSELAEIAETQDQMQEQIEKIQPQVQKLSNLLGQLRNMISYDSEDFIRFDVNNNLVESIQILELFKPKIFNLDNHFSDQELPVKGDPVQINQIHLNAAKIFFKTIKHDQNRIIKISTSDSSISQLKSKGFPEYLQSQAVSYWNKIEKIAKNFAIISYSSSLIDLTEQELAPIFADQTADAKIDKQVRLSFDIIRDITRRHLGNFLLNSDKEQTTFCLILPLLK